ncbi:MAG: helix-turn-helix transcriptional regulator [Dehalococcoidia bacterium]|nr:helix-turn-helix transcriptional regulator [Dehalococcoidia bacterium]
MNQTELAESLGVSKAYVSMVLSGKKQPSKKVAEALGRLGVNLKVNQNEAKSSILSHARLPVPTLPQVKQGPKTTEFCEQFTSLFTNI